MLKKNLKMFLALYLTFLILLFLFISESYIITHQNHNCTGKDCTVCEQIHMMEAIVQQLSNGLLIFTFIILSCFITLKRVAFRYTRITITPILMKVRMNH